ncbi:hypothetical protein V8F06_006209 [Rhypophila decipiens]
MNSILPLQYQSRIHLQYQQQSAHEKRVVSTALAMDHTFHPRSHYVLESHVFIYLWFLIVGFVPLWFYTPLLKAEIPYIAMATRSESGQILLPVIRVPDAPVDPERYVAWQTAWWSLVPLAIAAMTQPCGNVLGVKDRNFRFYGRASPIVCIADVLYFIILVMLGSSFSPRKFRRNVRFELWQRFSDETGTASEADTERTTFARWTLLIIGGVPFQTIKLVAMKGMLWTKLWALCFLASLIFWEVMAVLAREVQTNHSIRLPIPRWRKELPLLVSTMDLAFHVPFTCHYYLVHSAASTVLYWSLFSVSDLDFFAAALLCFAASTFAFAFPIFIQFLRRQTIMSIMPFLAYVGLMLFWEVLHITIWRTLPPSLLLGERQYWEQYKSYLDNYLRSERTPSKEHFADIILPWTEIAIGARSETPAHLAFVFVEVCFASFLAMFVPAIFSLSTFKSLFQVDTGYGSYAVFTSLSTFTFSLLWYRYMFQPFGTYSPDWTEVFG